MEPFHRILPFQDDENVKVICCKRYKLNLHDKNDPYSKALIWHP